QYNIIPPDNPVIGIIGNSAVLPCQIHVQINPDKLSVQWSFSGASRGSVVATYSGNNQPTPVQKHQEYQGRTDFFLMEFQRGNVSLLLTNIQPSDKGKYICSVFAESWYDQVEVDLEVAAAGDKSMVFLDGRVGNGIKISCRSQGWFPAPTLDWRDNRGRERPEPAITENISSSSGVFSVQSSMILEPGSDRELSCTVVNDLLKASCGSRLRISNSFFPSTDPWMVVSLGILLLDLGILGAMGYKLKGESFQREPDAEIVGKAKTQIK
ncbi:BT3A3 protein, partial [Sapayoa aenigma]|nr:BT3A3 protein [Sapayoa aenigma]